MIVRRLLLSPLLLIVAVLGQLVVVNRVPLPGGGTPDLVLLVVAALGVGAGPVTGLLAGFAGGLAIDVAPPGGHLAGEYALVYCLVGYACGRIRDLVQGSSAQRSAMASLTVMAIGVTAGEAGKAALGLMVSDPNMTGPAIRHVLPAALVYDLLLCAFALWLVSAAVGRPAAESAPEPHFPQAFRLVPAFRLASVGAAPGLRLAGSSLPLVPTPVRSEPRLRLGSGRSPSLSRTNSGFSSVNSAAVGGRPVKLNFASTGRGNQLAGASALRAARVANFQRKSPGKGWLRPGKPAGTAVHHPASPAKGWARGPKPGSAGSAWRPASPRKGWARGDRLVSANRQDGSATRTWRPVSPGKGWVRPARLPRVPAWRPRSPGNGWLRPVKPAPPPRRRSPARGWARGDMATASIRRPASPGRAASPGKGWLSVSPPVVPPGWRRQSPGRGWLRPAKPALAPHRKSPGRGWLRPAKPPKLNWYTRSPSTRWLRRGRRRRLLLGGRR